MGTWYFLLNFSINLKLLQKLKSIFKRVWVLLTDIPNSINISFLINFFEVIIFALYSP